MALSKEFGHAIIGIDSTGIAIVTTEIYANQRQRYDTKSNWQSNNPVLFVGEMGIESDTRKFKFGDGTTAWNNLRYARTGSAIVAAMIFS